MSMSVSFNTQSAQSTSTDNSGANKTSELENKFNDLKDKPDGAEKSQGLKDLKKEVDDELKNEEKKPGGGDDDKMKKLLELLQMIMQMLQGGGGGEGGGGGGGTEGAQPK